MLTALLLLISALLCFAIFYKTIEWFEKILPVESMITLVFIIALLVFAYMLYVLIRPEKF